MLSAAVLSVAGLAVGAPAQAAPAPVVETTAVVTGASEADGLTVKVDGSGYSDLPVASTGSAAAGVYVALRDKSISNEQINADTGLAAKVNFLYGPAAISGGVFSTEVKAPTAKLEKDAEYEVIVWVAHGNITDATLLDTVPVTLSDTHKDALFPTPEEPEEPVGGTPKVTVSSSRITAGGNLTIRGSGFAADESVAATVHSDPVSLGSKAASAAGNVTFTWKVPKNFAPGAHHVELVATSGTARINFTVAAPAVAPTPAPTVTCRMETVPATGGTARLLWGVKTSFVTYIEGGIAKGSISASNGASRTGNDFLWGAGLGTLNSSGQGTLSFPGSVRFTGHSGALNTKLSNLRVRSSGGNNGVLIANVVSQDLDGNNTGGNNLTIASLRFSGVSSNGGNASATLTAAGARAFADFYSAGESLDGLTVSFSGAGAASQQQVCYDEDGNRVNPDGTAYVGTGLNANLGGYALTPKNTSVSGTELAAAGLLLMLLLVLRRGTKLLR